MSDQLTGGTAQQVDAHGALRVLALVAVGVGVAALAGAAFVLSYPGIHAFAAQAGISPRLARGYPLIFDVLLVIILAAVLSLRGAGLPSKALAWICLLALVTAAAGADALHAAGHRLPAQSAAVTAAVVPWALVLISFALLLAMLRQARLRRLSMSQHGGDVQPRWQPQLPPPLPTQPLVPGFGDRLAGPQIAPRLPVPSQAAPEPAANAAEGPDSDPAAANPSGEGDAEVLEMADAADEPDTADAADLVSNEDGPDTTTSEDVAPQDEMQSPASAASDGEADPEMPVFHRMWSSPTPPAD